MKALVALMVVAAMGCSAGNGANGGDGSDGSNGQDGQQGSDGADGDPGQDGAPGADGKDGAPGPAGADGAPGKDAAGSGTRLKAQRLVAEDGASKVDPYAWFDTTLGIQCAFVRLQDGVLHCAPLLVQAQYGLAFSDPQCSKPAYYAYYASCQGSGYAFEAGGPAACPFDPQYAVRKLGAMLPAGTVAHVLNPVTMACTPAATPGGVFEVGSLVDPTDFVAATIETDP